MKKGPFVFPLPFEMAAITFQIKELSKSILPLGNATGKDILQKLIIQQVTLYLLPIRLWFRYWEMNKSEA